MSSRFSFRRIFAMGSTSAERRQRERYRPNHGKSILVVDDSTTIVYALRRMLDQGGFRTLAAYDAETALTIAKNHHPDLIFMDVVLPGMNGFEATRHLRKQPETQNTPIVVMSGNQQATERFWVIRIGANDFMVKPFTRREVFEKVERLLAQSEVA